MICISAQTPCTGTLVCHIQCVHINMYFYVLSPYQSPYLDMQTLATNSTCTFSCWSAYRYMQMALHHALLPISCLHREHSACPAAGDKCCTSTSPGTKKGDEGERGEMRYHVKYLRAVGVPLQMTRGSNTLPFTAVSPPSNLRRNRGRAAPQQVQPPEHWNQPVTEVFIMQTWCRLQ